MNKQHPYITGTRANWQRKHALTVTGEYEVCGIERQMRPGDEQYYYYATIIYKFTEQGRRVNNVVTRWDLDGTNADANFDDLDMRTVLV